jgi:hypothetical protein
VRFALGVSTRRGDEALKRRRARPQQLALEQLARRGAQQRKRRVVLQRVLDEEFLKASKVGILDVTESRDHGGALTMLARGAVGWRVRGEVCRVAVELARQPCDARGRRLAERTGMKPSQRIAATATAVLSLAPEAW